MLSFSRSALFVFLAMATSFGDRCFADFIPVVLGPNQGNIVEKGTPGKLVAVTWTTNSGTGLGTTAIVAIPAGGVLNIPVPALSPDKNGNLRRVYDYVQFSKDGPDNYLSVEAFIPSGPDFLEYQFLDYIASIDGPSGVVSIPDLYGDTSGNGVLDDDDVIYSAVNLALFMPANVTFQLGDTFTITNGTSAALPGMIFGTQPITLDASSPDGFSNPDPYTGLGSAFSQHDNVVTPEPANSISALLGLAAGGLAFYSSRRARGDRRSQGLVSSTPPEDRQAH
jgi:hypothetical protein